MYKELKQKITSYFIYIGQGIFITSDRQKNTLRAIEAKIIYCQLKQRRLL